MRLGEYQKLVVIKKVEFGVYLAERMEDETRVLLPEKQVPEGTKIGDEDLVLTLGVSLLRFYGPAHCDVKHTEADIGRSCGADCKRGWKDRSFP